MCSQSEVMHCYEQIAPLLEQMLGLTRTGDWGELPDMETQYSSMVDHLKAIEPLETLDQAQRARKYQLLSRITSHHAEMSNLLAPELAKLGTALKSLEQQQCLQKTYGQAADAYS